MRKAGAQGSSHGWARSLDSDSFAGADAQNPFRSWNRVFLRYCSGDTWTGRSQRSVFAPGTERARAAQASPRVRASLLPLAA